MKNKTINYEQKNFNKEIILMMERIWIKVGKDKTLIVKTKKINL